MGLGVGRAERGGDFNGCGGIRIAGDVDAAVSSKAIRSVVEGAVEPDRDEPGWWLDLAGVVDRDGDFLRCVMVVASPPFADQDDDGQSRAQTNGEDDVPLVSGTQVVFGKNSKAGFTQRMTQGRGPIAVRAGEDHEDTDGTPLAHIGNLSSLARKGRFRPPAAVDRW